LNIVMKSFYFISDNCHLHPSLTVISDSYSEAFVPFLCIQFIRPLVPTCEGSLSLFHLGNSWDLGYWPFLRCKLAFDSSSFAIWDLVVPLPHSQSREPFVAARVVPDELVYHAGLLSTRLVQGSRSPALPSVIVSMSTFTSDICCHIWTFFDFANFYYSEYKIFFCRAKICLCIFMFTGRITLLS
jgi:hypothetical protein